MYHSSAKVLFLMPRRELHPEEVILDGARAVVLERGARGATITAVATACGAPTGSIYHRFASLDEVLAKAWMRAIGRAQDEILRAQAGEVVETAVARALGVYDFCLRDPADGLLLSSFRQSDFDAAALRDEVRHELAHLNDRIDPFFRALARALGGPAQMDLALLAVRDLPYGAALPHIRDGTTPPPRRRVRLESAVRAVLARTPQPRSVRRPADVAASTAPRS
jgi:AcrR family transcriptional regulator